MKTLATDFFRASSFLRTIRCLSPTGFVLWLGDSVVEAVGNEFEDSIPELLTARQPSTAHVNMGYAGTGTDFHLLTLERCLARFPVDLVVLVAVDNDVEDLSNEYACCPGGNLLLWSSTGEARPRCTEARRIRSPFEMIAHSPFPYPLRVAASFSYFARWSIAMWGGRPGAGTTKDVTRWEQTLAAIVRRCRQEGIPLVYVRHRMRWSVVDAATGAGGTDESFPRIIEEAGGARIDLLEPLMNEYEKGSLDSLFPPGDPTHFSKEGLGVMAEVLSRWLEAEGLLRLSE